ncbi:hypothetical protein QOZ80_7AG0560460 [Eleusine coracana subsp. coracana]|nr:hypothetical protein QOZ80_7AG0560460 [Eleusine coracana subsp. coracana]
MAAAAAGAAALGGPHPNPSGDGPGRLQSLPGKGKPVALADITNTGRRNATRSLSVADVVKENAKLVQLLNEKTRIIDVSRVEMQKLHLALQASRQQNLQLAQANSQMVAELNLGKDRLKALQHELSCTVALLKVKDSELEKKNKAANKRRKEVNSQDVMKVMPSKVAAGNAHQIDDSGTSATRHHLDESIAAVLSSTACQEPPDDTTTKSRNKRKSESSEFIKETNIMQDSYKPHLQPVLSLDHDDPRKHVRRRSSRLNAGSCEVTEASCSKLHENDAIPSALSNVSIQKQYEPTAGNDMPKSLQSEHSCEAAMASVFKKMDINDQPRDEANLKDAQEAYSSVPGIEAHQVGDKTSTTKQSHLAETQCVILNVNATATLPFNIVEPPGALEGTGNERVINKPKLKSGKDSAIEHTSAKCDSNDSEGHNEKKKSHRRKSARLDSLLSENTMSTSEILHEDVIAPLPPSGSNASMEHMTNQKQTDGCSSTKATEGQVAGRRSLRRAAEKVISYKEIPLNVKMRRP